MRGVALLSFVVLLIAVPITAWAGPGDCDFSQIQIGGCPTVTGTLDDDEAVLTGTRPGASASRSGGQPEEAGPVEPRCGANSLDVCRFPLGVVELPTPTLNDIAAFRPTVGVDHMEPDGWFVVGLDANFYATGGTSVRSGTLLGYPASVRFTPIRWSWNYGDGQSATRSTPGASWAAQRAAEFDPTATSHVYSAAGTYYIDLTIGYRAEYNFDGAGWALIDGILWLPANRLVATVGGAKTVLVERECTTASSGPGC